MKWLKKIAIEGNFQYVNDDDNIEICDKKTLRLDEEQFEFFKRTLEDYILKTYKDDIVSLLEDSIDEDRGFSETYYNLKHNTASVEFKVSANAYQISAYRSATHWYPEEHAQYEIDTENIEIELV